jgi:4-amino-4-deoxy-L-arabinose transferase-like glycosyltransferase
LQPRECNRQPNLERNPPPNPRFAVPSGFTIPTSASDASKLIQHLTAMTLIASPEPATTSPAAAQSRKSRALWMLTALWLALFVASLFSPPVLDDADGTHANAARQMLLSGDWVTLRVNNVRYLEKAPLPYWITAVSFRLFGFNTFAAHLPEALSVLLLMLLGFRWAREAYGEGAALYTGFGVLTSAGVFLFTRVFIPDVLLSLLLAAALYCFLRALEPSAKTVILSEAQSAKSKDPEEVDPSTTARALLPANLYPYLMWTALALAVLTKGLVAIVFLFGAAIPYLALTGEYRNWRRLRPFTGTILFLAIAAPWHILAGLRNTGGMNGHGFFWFYFINEHVLRFLGRRIPRDYNKLPGYLYWSLHLVWLFPWALFLPTAFVTGWRLWRQRRNAFRHAIKMGRIKEPRPGPPYGVSYDFRSSRNMFLGALRHAINTFAARSTLLHLLFSALVLLFFSLSTNQEYYTFPAYLPLLMLLGAALARGEDNYAGTDTQAKSARRWITFAHAAFTVLGILISIALAYGLWTSRHLAALPSARRAHGFCAASAVISPPQPPSPSPRPPSSSPRTLHSRDLPPCFRRRIWPPKSSSLNPPAPSPTTTSCCSTATRPTARRFPSTSIARSTGPRCWSTAARPPCSLARHSPTRRISSSLPPSCSPSGVPVRANSCLSPSCIATMSIVCSARAPSYYRRPPAKRCSPTDLWTNKLTPIDRLRTCKT